MNHSELADNDMDPKREKTSQQEATADGDNAMNSAGRSGRHTPCCPLVLLPQTGKVNPIPTGVKIRSFNPPFHPRAERRAQILHHPGWQQTPPSIAATGWISRRLE